MLNDNTNFESVELASFLDRVAALKAQNARFVQMHAVRKPGGFDLHYTFSNPDNLQAINWIVRLDDGVSIPSITPFYVSAFFNENEAHDLFGVDITGICLDYHGTFYQVAVPTPMNPDYVDGKPPVPPQEDEHQATADGASVQEGDGSAKSSAESPQDTASRERVQVVCQAVPMGHTECVDTQQPASNKEVQSGEDMNEGSDA